MELRLKEAIVFTLCVNQFEIDRVLERRRSIRRFALLDLCAQCLQKNILLQSSAHLSFLKRSQFAMACRRYFSNLPKYRSKKRQLKKVFFVLCLSGEKFWNHKHAVSFDNFYAVRKPSVPFLQQVQTALASLRGK